MGPTTEWVRQRPFANFSGEAEVVRMLNRAVGVIHDLVSGAEACFAGTKKAGLETRPVSLAGK